MGRALAWIAVCIGLSVGAVSAVLGMAPTYVKPSPSGVLVHCGPALFHTGPRPSPWCDARPDVWRIAAEIGLGLAAILFLTALVLFVFTPRPGSSASRAATPVDQPPIR